MLKQVTTGMLDMIYRIIVYDPWHASRSYVASCLAKSFDMKYDRAVGILAGLLRSGALYQMKGPVRGFPVILGICKPAWDSYYCRL